MYVLSSIIFPTQLTVRNYRGRMHMWQRSRSIWRLHTMWRRCCSHLRIGNRRHVRM